MQWFDSLSSTNDKARELAQGGAPHGEVIVAREQTSGRGRHGRVWYAPQNNLNFSMILRPAIAAARAQEMQYVAGLAVRDALIALGCEEEITLKWPNDIILKNKKLAGILVESASSGNAVIWMVVGIGVNIKATPAEAVDYPAIALDSVMQKAPTPEALAVAVSDALLNWYQHWLGGFSKVREAWLESAWKLNENIKVRLASEEISGMFRGVDEEGFGLIETKNGLEKLNQGDVIPL